jgi:signal transduction histidine kinase
MIQRFTRYTDNRGLWALMMDAGFIAFIFYRINNFSYPLFQLFLVSIFTITLFIPLAFSAVMIKHASVTIRVVKITRYAFFALLLILISNLLPQSVTVLLTAILLGLLSISIGFWFYSHPAIMLPEAYEKMRSRQESAEEKALLMEIDWNQELNDENEMNPPHHPDS